MRILTWPDYEDRVAENPYNALLYRAMQAGGLPVDPLTASNLFAHRYSVFHLHWPESLLNIQSAALATSKTLSLLAALRWLRLRGTKLVWTVHNLAAHDKKHPQLEAWFWNSYVPRVDAFITLSRSGVETVRSRFLSLKNTPAFVVPHPHYRDQYLSNETRQSARVRLGIESGVTVLLYFGVIRSYKNVPGLLSAFAGTDNPNLRLLVIGKPWGDIDEDALSRQASEDSRVQLLGQFIPNDEVQLYFHAADLVVLPYKEILNSGTALLALSFNRPILVPDRGAMGDLRADVGDAWVRTYPGELCPQDLADGLDWLKSTDRAPLAPLDPYGAETVVLQTLQAYQQVAPELGPRVSAWKSHAAV